MPVLSKITEPEKEVYRQQVNLVARLRKSAYYITDEHKTDGTSSSCLSVAFRQKSYVWDSLSCGLDLELERYSDRFRPTFAKRPVLDKDLLGKEFFPSVIWEAHFNPKKKSKGMQRVYSVLKPDLIMGSLTTLYGCMRLVDF